MLKKQLHLANIANVAYGYSGILRQFGQDASVLCYDLRHILSQPEWYDGDFETPPLQESQFNPRDAVLKPFTPPAWYQRIRSQDYWVSDQHRHRRRVLTPDWIATLIHTSRRYGQRWTLTEKDILSYKPLADAMSVNFFPHYDVIFGYAYGAVLPLLAAIEPYVAVEIGTMRETPFEDSALGRLLALAYRTAPHTIITNADVLSAAHELGIENYTHVPHPVDEDVYTPLPSDQRTTLKKRYCASTYLLVAPARHHWEVKANQRYLKAFAKLVRNGVDATLVLSEWGPDVATSKDLIAAEGISQRVKWLSPLPERALVRLYNAADLVLDQFGGYGTFGLIAPKVLSCETPVVLSFDPALHRWCFPEVPPVIGARTEEEICCAVRHYLLHEEARAAQAHQGREWILKHHSKAVVARKVEAIIDSLQKPHVVNSTRFASLRQKRLELDYEHDSVTDYDEKYHKGVAYRWMDKKLTGKVAEMTIGWGVRNPRVLDLGCGPGSMTAKLLEIPGIRLTGVDISPSMIALARQRFPGIDFQVDDMEGLCFEDNGFDLVFCSGVLHHLPMLQRVLKEIHRVLKPGGVLLVREPNRDNFAYRHPEAAFAHLCLRHYLYCSLNARFVLEPEAPDYHRDFSFDELVDELGNQLEVFHFETDLRLGYFYDMLRDERQMEALSTLEDSIHEQPGLNVVVAARKGGTLGATVEVLKQVSHLREPKPLRPEHFIETQRFALKQIARSKPWFHWERSEKEGKSPLAYAVSKLRPSAILVTAEMTSYSHVASLLDELARAISRLPLRREDRQTAIRRQLAEAATSQWPKVLARAMVMKLRPMLLGTKIMRSHWLNPNLSARLKFVPLGELSGLPEHRYDLVVVRADSEAEIRMLDNAVEAFSDYGLVYLELAQELVPKLPGVEGLDVLSLLERFRSEDSAREGFFLVKHAYSAWDFFQALSVALTKAFGDPEAWTDNRLKRVYEEVKHETEIRKNEFSKINSPSLYQALSVESAASAQSVGQQSGND